MNLTWDLFGSILGTITTISLFFFWIFKSQFISKTEFEEHKQKVDKSFEEYKENIGKEIRQISNGHSDQNTKLALMDNNINHIMESIKEIKETNEKNTDKIFAEIKHLNNNYKQLGDNILMYFKQLNESK